MSWFERYREWRRQPPPLWSYLVADLTLSGGLVWSLWRYVGWSPWAAVALGVGVFTAEGLLVWFITRAGRLRG